MNREEAANILDLKTRPEALADFVGPELAGIVHQAMIMGAEALRGPWVKTSDRLPTEADADSNGDILVYDPIDEKMFSFGYKSVEKFPASYLWWMPSPPLPEVEK